MNRIVSSTVALMALVVVAAACGGGRALPEAAPPTSTATPTSTIVPVTSTTTAATTTSNVGGDRLPVQIAGEVYGHFPAPLTGSLGLAPNGCWTIDLGDGPRLVVFPTGSTKPAADGTIMRMPDGTDLSDGMAVDAVGGIVAADTLPGTPDGFWGGYVGFCGGERPEVVVVDALQPEFDPSALGDGELAALLAEADLTVSWPCGIGFAVSTADQRVAVLLSYADSAEGGVATPVTFPDAKWEAVVKLGKNLMANNCDDVVEGWEPLAKVVATWSISAGVLDYAHPGDGGCGGGGPVTATLRGAVVNAPGGAIELEPLTMVNEAYGCYAG